MIAKLTEDSQRDLLRGIDWFEKISTGLGDRFESEFYNALNRITENPYLFPANHTGFRPCLDLFQLEVAHFCFFLSDALIGL